MTIYKEQESDFYWDSCSFGVSITGAGYHSVDMQSGEKIMAMVII